MTSPLCVATGGWFRRVFHYRPPTPMYRNSPPLCTIVLQIPSLMPLKMRKVQQRVSLDTLTRSVRRVPYLLHSLPATGGAGAAGSSLGWSTSPKTSTSSTSPRMSASSGAAMASAPFASASGKSPLDYFGSPQGALCESLFRCLGGTLNRANQGSRRSGAPSQNRA